MSEYTCSVCNISYTKIRNEEWNETKAREEFISLYPECRDDPVSIVCDKCNEEFRIWFTRLSDEEKKQMREDFYI